MPVASMMVERGRMLGSHETISLKSKANPTVEEVIVPFKDWLTSHAVNEAAADTAKRVPTAMHLPCDPADEARSTARSYVENEKRSIRCRGDGLESRGPHNTTLLQVADLHCHGGRVACRSS